jgi:outer membrane receptor for ferric coprogen and ferric-rhodotorulic acid
MDLLARFKTGAITHRVLAAVDISDFARPLTQTLGAYSSALDGGQDKLSTNPDSPYYYAGKRLSFRPGSSLPVNDGGYGWYGNAFENIKTLNADYNWKKFTAGALVSYRASLWRDRLAIMASLRYDYFDDLYDNKMPGKADGTLNGSGITYSFGENLKIIGESLLAYISVSTGFEPINTVDDGIDKIVPPQKSFGAECGFKGDLGNGKAGYTISFYEVELQNVRSNNPDFEAAGGAGNGVVSRYNTGNLNTAKGIDASFFFRPARNLTLQGAVGRTASVTNKADDPFALGMPLQYVSKWNGSLVVRYEIPRWNVVTGVGMRAQTRFLCNYATSTINDLWRPGLFLADAFVNYKFKWGKTTHKIALNLSNITNKKYYTNTGRLNYGFEGRLSYNFNY